MTEGDEKTHLQSIADKFTDGYYPHNGQFKTGRARDTDVQPSGEKVEVDSFVRFEGFVESISGDVYDLLLFLRLDKHRMKNRDS
jgi:hypothetical protein